jgi:excinuclease UvrABC helicase subunit UvrB
MRFELAGNFEPRGDQPQAIAELVDGVTEGQQHQTLLGVTGSEVPGTKFRGHITYLAASGRK